MLKEDLYNLLTLITLPTIIYKKMLTKVNKNDKNCLLNAITLALPASLILNFYYVTRADCKIC